MAVGHSAASVRPHGRRWIATSTTSCARASASPVTVSPCFGPCHALVPANCTRPTPRLSQLVNEMAPTLALPPRGRCGRDRHTAAAVVPQRHLRGRVRGRAGRQGHQGLGCAEGERGGGRRRGVKRGARRVTGSLLARRGRSGSAQFITWPRLVTPWRGRGHSPLVRATPLASRHCFQMSGRMFPHFSDKVSLKHPHLSAVFCAAARSALSRSSSPCNRAAPHDRACNSSRRLWKPASAAPTVPTALTASTAWPTTRSY